jgi:hypothetical protein
VSPARVAVDVGTLLVKVVTTGGALGAEQVQTRRVGHDGLRAVLIEMSAAGPELCLAVPDSWLDGGVAGGRKQEELRRLAEDELGLTNVRWAGQLAAVSALSALAEGRSGRYLVCDVGGNGVRVALCQVAVSGSPGTVPAVRQVAVHAVSGGGWRDFGTAVRDALGAGGDPGLDSWWEDAVSQDRRARMVFDRAKTAPDFLAARAYSLTGAHGAYKLTAGRAAECFAATADRIRAAVQEVVSGLGQDGAELTAVLTGGLAWFPLSADTLAEATGTTPVIVGLEAAARGALLLADGQAGLGGCGLPPVRLPMHQVKDGLLEEVSVALPWTASFPDAPLYIDKAELTLDVGASRVTISLPGLSAGHYRTAARPSWTGAGVLVLRPDWTVGPHRMTMPSDADTGSGVQVVPLGSFHRRGTSDAER